MKLWIKIKPQYRVLILVFLFGSLCTSCVQLLELDRAQSQFNQAATIDNQLRFSPSSAISSSPEMYYNAAYSSVKKALQKSSELKQDKVLANAYVIEALSAWRLKKYNEARRAASDATQELESLEREDGILMPRDKALMKLVPTLIDIDVARAEMKAKLSESNLSFNQASAYFTENVFNADSTKVAKLEAHFNNLEEERTKTERDGNIDDDFPVYLLMAQLATLKNCTDGLDIIRRIAENENKLRLANEFSFAQRGNEDGKHGIIGKKKSLMILLEKRAPESVVSFWRNLF